VIGEVPEVGDIVRTRRIPRYNLDGNRVGKVISVHVGPFLLGGDPAEQKYDILVEFGNGEEVWPHWKLITVSPLEALARQASDGHRSDHQDGGAS
jgi:hypothetical protein